MNTTSFEVFYREDIDFCWTAPLNQEVVDTVSQLANEVTSSGMVEATDQSPSSVEVISWQPGKSMAFIRYWIDTRNFTGLWTRSLSVQCANCSWSITLTNYTIDIKDRKHSARKRERDSFCKVRLPKKISIVCFLYFG